MKKLITIFALAGTLAGGRAALPAPDLIAHLQFAGAEKITAATNAGAFTNQFCSAEAQALRARVADKLAPWLAGWLQAHAGAAPGGAAQLRPLLDDFATAEWGLEARAGAGAKPAVALAIKLEPGRAQLWTEKLKAVLPAAGCQVTAGWLRVSYGAGAAALGDGLVPSLAGTNAPWFSADVNWPRLAQWYPQLKELGLPETQWAVTAPDDNFRITGRFFFPENLALKLGEWRVPTNALHQPFISLTAVRGFSGWLASQTWTAPYLISPVPDQFYAWALPQVPFQSFYAVPVPDAAGALAQLEPRLQPLFSAPNKARSPLMMPLQIQATNHEITFTGMPFIAPYIRAIQEPSGPFLFAGFFPNTPRSKPLPEELFKRLADPTLVFYHWEITAERFGVKFDLLPQLSQLGLMLTGHQQLDGTSAIFHWLQKIGPTLGNNITEIKRVGPAEFSFTRKAPGIFTAVEFLALGSWLEAKNFPGCDLKLPPRPVRSQPLPAVQPAPGVPNP